MGMGKSWAILAAVFCASANAQVEPAFRGYGVAQGLPSNRVVDIQQDRRGLLWFATPDGLASFDGVAFRVFRNEPDRTDSIHCNDVQTIFEDSRERLWFGCAERGFGLLRDREAGAFDAMTAVQAPLGYDSLDVFAFAESAAGHLWLGTYRHGLLRLDAEAAALQPLDEWMSIPDALKTADVLELTHDRLGDLWLATTSGLWRIRNIDTPELVRVEQLLSGVMVLTLFTTRDGYMWIGSADAVHRLKIGGEAASIEPVDTGPKARVVDAIAEDRAGVIWLGSSTELIMLAPGEPGVSIHTRPAVPGSFPGSHVHDAVVDHEGGLWIATRTRGVGYVRPDRDNFELIRHDPLDDSSLPGTVAAVEACRDGHTYLVTLTGALAELASDGRVRRIGASPRTVAEGRSTHSLSCDANNQLWLGLPGAVVRLDPRTGAERRWGEAEGIVPGFVELVVAGHAGEIWMSSLGSGISRIDAEGHVSVWQTAERGIAIADFEQIGIAPDGGVWLADALGLRRLEPDSQIFVQPKGGPDQRVTAMSFTADGEIWTASSDGLQRWRMVGDELLLNAQIGATEGLPAVSLYSLVAADSGELWMTSPRGLWRARLEPPSVELVDTLRGLPDVQFSPRPTTRLIGDQIVAVTIEGVLRFNPHRLIRIDTPPPLHLVSASVRRGDLRVALNPHDAHWGLRWNDRDLQVSARVFSFVNSSANHYRFLLEGHDNEWVDTGARPEREFSSIAAGEFRLRIGASNLVGVAADRELSRSLSVSSPPWFSWQAWAAYALGFVLLVWAAVSNWRQRIERRHRLAIAEERRASAERANSAKSDFLADIGHEIRTPMAGLLGMTDLLSGSALRSEQQRWTISIKRSGEHMLRLINDLLDLSRIEAGRLEINPQATELSALIDDVRTLEAPIAEARGMTFQTEVDPALPQWALLDGRRVRQILLNLVNNALKFTERGSVRVSAQAIGGGWMRLRVADTGPGMSADQVALLFERFRQTLAGQQKGGSGLGLAISAQLAHLLGGRIEVASTPGVGSQFDVWLPVVPCDPMIMSNHDPIQEQGAAPLAGVHALLVEDDPALREINTHLLQGLGATVDVSQHALDALSRFDTTRHRLLLIDLDLPGIDGMQLLELLRRRSDAIRLHAVAVTARSEAGTEQRCREAGFDDFLRKPVSAEQLAAAASSWQRALAADR